MNAETDNTRLTMLAAMGIDVWVRRTADPPPADRTTPARRAPDVRATAPPHVSEPSAPEPRTSSHDVAERVDATSPVVWTAVGVGHVVLLARLDTPPDRRLAQDIAAAAAGYPAETPAVVAFSRTRAAQTRADGGAFAPEVVAFVRGQIDRRRGSGTTAKAPTLILSEGAARELLLHSADTAAPEFHGVAYVVVPEMAALRASPERKQNVWRALIRPR